MHRFTYRYVVVLRRAAAPERIGEWATFRTSAVAPSRRQVYSMLAGGVGSRKYQYTMRELASDTSFNRLWSGMISLFSTIKQWWRNIRWWCNKTLIDLHIIGH